jgi:beta-glucosidase
MKKYIILLFFFVWVAVAFSQKQRSRKVPQLSTTNIKQVVAAMTLEEKATLVIGTGMRMESTEPVIGEIDGRVLGAAGSTSGIPRLGIPITVLADGPAGVRIAPIRNGDSKTYYGSSFPVATLLASTWNVDLVRKVGVALGNEMREYGVDVALAPAMNIHRNPLNGRNAEYFSEDPLITGNFATAMVKGIQSTGVAASIKHFAANNQESNRRAVNSIISERALREIYLKGFEIAVKNAHPLTVMSSYNKLNGVYTSEDYNLLSTILRKEWGYDGIVMTDWSAGKDVVAQQKAGNDLIEPGTKTKSLTIVDAVKNGQLDVKVLDQNVERILNYIVKTPSFKKYKFSNQPDLKGHAVIGRKAAEEGMILLKNEANTLPLKKGLKIALFGNASYATIINCNGSSDVHVAYDIPIFEGFTNAGYSIIEDLKTRYTNYIKQDKINNPGRDAFGRVTVAPEYLLPTNFIETCTNDADVAVFTIGRNSGENRDRVLDTDFNLSDSEKSFIHDIATTFHAKGKKFIILINSAGVIETASWKNYADAILLTWAPGQDAGAAIANVVCGNSNPSGKLATTFPVKYEDVPSSKCFPGTPADRPKDVVYEEGIYVGYRYYNSFGVKPSYEFGFGLSYTQFSYSNLRLSSSTFNGSIKATVTITNTGKVAGKEVVQLYLSAPSKRMDKPAEELKGFAKTELLKPNASQTITFVLNTRDLASFDTTQSAWISDAGNYTIKIGASCENIKLNKSFTLPENIIVERTTKALIPSVRINELTNRINLVR